MSRAGPGDALAPIRVLGIDPGTRLCGWGVVARVGARLEHVDNGVVVLDPKAALADRLARLLEALEGVLGVYRPDAAACESVFHNRNARAALTLGHARGVALAALARSGLAVSEYTPQQVKKAVTGSGRADKAQIQQMVALRLALPEPPQADAADAVAVALCHAQHGGVGVTGVVLPTAPRGGRRRSQAALKALATRQEKGRR